MKTTICVDDQSQLIVSYNAYFGVIQDSKEFKKTLEKMDREIISKFKIIIGDKGYFTPISSIILEIFLSFSFIYFISLPNVDSSEGIFCLQKILINILYRAKIINILYIS